MTWLTKEDQLMHEINRLEGERDCLKSQLAGIRLLVTGNPSRGNALDDATIIHAWCERRIAAAGAKVNKQLARTCEHGIEEGEFCLACNRIVCGLN